MSLGVLNNLNAIYAENNLNNTSNSLSTVLQQLSSGSKINSGADDSAGLSLVNGLQANNMALSQSKTNASEGVGLLTVADGALSQVTNLLNRAVTLATEASNGTLNSSQDTAANQEYQSILSEISNIGSTTTYNNQAVFGTTTNIFTGDSSTTGASIDNLNIRSLSSSNVGDTAGQMAYSSGTDNVFIDLSKNGTNAAVTDSLGTASQTTTIAVSYLSKGANGAAITSSANISVGAGTSYQNTAQGLLNAINNSGLGLTASFGTATQAGTESAATAVAASDTNSALLTTANDTGIIISGAGVGVNTNSGGVYANGAGEVGTVTVSQSNDTLGGTLTIAGTDGVNHSINLGVANSTDTLANVAATINTAGYGVTASINTVSTTNASGTHAAGTVLTFTSSNSKVTVNTINATDATTETSGSLTAGSPSVSTAGTTLATLLANSATDTLSGVLDLGKGTGGTANGFVDLGGQTVAQILANTADTNAFTAADIAATANSTGTGIIFTAIHADASNPTIAVDANSSIQDSTQASGTVMVQQNNVAGPMDALTSVGTAVALANSSGATAAILTVNAASDLMVGTLTLTAATGTGAAGLVGGSISMTGQSLTSLFGTGGSALSTLNAAGLNATLSQNNTVVTFTEAGSYGTHGATIADGGTVQDNAATLGTVSVTNAYDILSGTLNLSNSANTAMTAMTLGNAGTTDNLADLTNYINNTLGGGSSASHVVATLNATGTQMSLSLNAASSGTHGAGPMIYGTSMDSTLSLTGTPPASNTNQTTLGTLALPAAGSSSNTLSGTLVLGTESIVLGTAATSSTAGTATMTELAQTINTGTYGVHATLNSTATAIVFTSPDAVNVNVVPPTGAAGNPKDTTTSTYLTWNVFNGGVTNSNYYSVGIAAGGASGAINDTSTGGGTATMGLSFNGNGSGGTATISYSDTAGESLSNSDLSTQADAQATLTALNKAIADVAAQDGYIGAQINTLNSVSSVLSTQAENVTSAQNAVQATDYASATSNMSKYEILSQTGISALAQANTMQQEVTKLLQ